MTEAQWHEDRQLISCYAMEEFGHQPDPVPWHRGPAFFLLLSLVALYIALPLVQEISGNRPGPTGALVSGTLVCGVLVLGIRAVTRKRRAVLWTACTAAMGLLLATWSAVDGSSAGRPTGVGLVALAVFTAFLMSTTVLMLRMVLRNERVNADKIFAAICAYFLLGFTFAFGLTFLWGAMGDELFRFPQPLDAARTPSRAAELVYFSFTTLTTLGYGDMAPTTPLTRALATLEALTGQFYVGIIVARLVSLQLSHAKE